MAQAGKSMKSTAQGAAQAVKCPFPDQAPNPTAQCNQKGGPKKPLVKTGLGEKTDKIVSKSPPFVQRVKNLQAKGYKFKYGKAGGGTYVDKTAKLITIDGDEKKNPTTVVALLAHEVGHAGYKDKYTPPDGLTKGQFVKANVQDKLRDEGEATLTNIALKRSLKKNCGPDIPIAGAHAKDYEKIFDKYPDTKDRGKARKEIGDIYADGEHPSNAPGKTYREYYSDFYSDYYDKYVGGKKK